MAIKRTMILRICVTPEEHADLMRLSKELGESMSNIVRRALRVSRVGFLRRERTIGQQIGHHHAR